MQQKYNFLSKYVLFCGLWWYNVTDVEVTDNGKPQETVRRKAKGAKTKVMPARPPNISYQA